MSLVKKQGWKTSEFWVTVATCLVTILNKAFGWEIPSEAILPVIGVAATYVLSRTVVKAIDGKTQPKE